jgi:hypothetical protein
MQTTIIVLGFCLAIVAFINSVMHLKDTSQERRPAQGPLLSRQERDRRRRLEALQVQDRLSVPLE